MSLCFFFSTVGVRTYLRCSKCNAHIGLLTDDDGELQYYTNGLAMTFSPIKKQVSILEGIDSSRTRYTDIRNIPPKLSMGQMLNMSKEHLTHHVKQTI